MKKRLGFVLALVLCGALSVGVAPRASAVGTIININAQSDWPTSGNITLADGDTLNIGLDAGSPAAAAVWIAADANVTINGGGVMRTNMIIVESPGDTVLSHTVTINNLQITSPANWSTYTQYSGIINLVGANAFVATPNCQGNRYALASFRHFMAITSSTGGTLTVSSPDTGCGAMGPGGVPPGTFDIQGNARVTVTSVGSPAVIANDVNVDSGASLTVNATNSSAIDGDYLVVANYGLLTVSGGTASTPALYSSLVSTAIEMGASAVTSITSTVPETDSYTMIPASGFQWQLSGGASLVAPDTVTSSPASITIVGGTTGVVKLVPPAPPSTPSLPMVRFTESPDMTGDGLGDTLAVDTLGFLWVFPGSPTGQFGSPVSRLGSDFKFLDIAAPGDIDGDKRADVLAIDIFGNLWLYPGNGAKALAKSRQVGNGWTG